MARYDIGRLNDVYSGGGYVAPSYSLSLPGTPAAIYSVVKTPGWSGSCVGTAIARTFTGSAGDKSEKETERLDYNQLIRDNAVAEGYTVLDFAGLSEMSTSTDLTYFVDGVHPTRTGYNVMGTYAAPIIAGYL